jgi:hexosaminidase
MKKALLLLLIFCIMKVNAQKNEINLIPQPVEMTAGSGSYQLSKSTAISYNKAECRNAADILTQKINLPTGFNLKAKKGEKGNIKLMLNDKENPQLGKEGYNLESDVNGVTISANQAAGLFYGVQTLLQLLPKEIESVNAVQANWTIPSVKITDYPRFGWRGLMLDVSRHFFTKEEVKKYIDRMSGYKFNTFHWHLTDDNGWRVEIKSLPKLTKIGAWRVQRYGHFGDVAAPKPGEPATYGGFYTQDDIKEIIKYAADRFITIVPEIDVPGHSMAAIASYPELCCTKDTSIKVNPGSNFADWYGAGKFKMGIDNSLNPSDEKVYEFLDKVFTEVAALFPGQYIHVGGDECYKGYWEQDEDCQALMKKENLKSFEEMQAHFLMRLQKIISSKGKKLIGWDEILEGGITPEAAVMSWRGMNGGIEAAKMGHEVVMSPTTNAYFDLFQGDPVIEPAVYGNLRLKKCYNFEPIPEGVDAKYILGAQGNLWTEQVPTLRHAEYMIYPRSWALSEVCWSPKEKKNWDNFVKKVEAHFERNDAGGINYSRAMYDAIVKTYMNNGKLTVNMETELADLDIFLTTDDTMPDKYSNKYTKPFELPEGPVTLRVITYRNDKPIGHLMIFKPEELKTRAGQ